jgi:FG-GAP-like repeat
MSSVCDLEARMRRVAILIVILGVMAPVSPAARGGQGHGENFVLVEESRLPPDTEQAGTSTLDIDLVDVDGDGDLDLFKAQGTDSLSGRPNQLLINTGTGQFVDESAQRLPFENLNSTKADWGDVDGDGDLDGIVAQVGGEQLLLNDGFGVFADGSSQLPAPLPLLSDISADAHFADVDGDGDLDILVSNEIPFPGPFAGAQSRLWINNGLGQFTDQTFPRLPVAIEQTVAMLPGDIDGDGDLDLIVLNRGQDKVLMNSGAGFFTDETSLRFPDTDDTSRAGGLADLDGDGDLDLVVGNSRGEAAALYFNDGVGRFAAGDFGMTPLPNETIAGLELVDLDADGDLDVYLSNAGQLLVGHGFLGGPDRYFRNNGQGYFVERTRSHFDPPNDPTTDSAFGDIDGDGDLDLVVGNSGENGGERVFVNYPCAGGLCSIRSE